MEIALAIVLGFIVGTVHRIVKIRKERKELETRYMKRLIAEKESINAWNNRD